VAVFDATNTTKARRKLLTERAREEKNALLVFIESICDDPEILAQNYKLKLQNDDYKHQDQQQALAVCSPPTHVWTLLLSLHNRIA
jgi:6-phosphofructo-2-kinase